MALSLTVISLQTWDDDAVHLSHQHAQLRGRTRGYPTRP